MKTFIVAVGMVCALFHQEDLRYRILKLETKPEHGGCIISLEHSVGVDMLKRVICRVIDKENLRHCRIISVVIYYGITELDDARYDPRPLPAAANNLIAIYAWNPGLSQPGTLIVVLDEKGIPIKGLNKSYNFAYSAECGK